MFIVLHWLLEKYYSSVISVRFPVTMQYIVLNDILLYVCSDVIINCTVALGTGQTRYLKWIECTNNNKVKQKKNKHVLRGFCTFV